MDSSVATDERSPSAKTNNNYTNTAALVMVFLFSTDKYLSSAFRVFINKYSKIEGIYYKPSFSYISKTVDQIMVQIGTIWPIQKHLYS